MTMTALVRRPTRAMLARLPDLWKRPPGPDVRQADDLYPACFADLKTVLLKHDKTRRFEVALLHRHYEIADDEGLFDGPGPRPGQWTTVAAAYERIDRQGGTPSLFQFTPGGGVYGTRYSDPACLDPLADDDIPCLVELAAVVCGHGLEGALGIALSYHSPDPARPFPFWAEYSSTSARYSTRTVVDALLPDSDDIVTHFRVGDDGGWVRLSNCPQQSHC